MLHVKRVRLWQRFLSVVPFVAIGFTPASASPSEPTQGNSAHRVSRPKQAIHVSAATVLCLAQKGLQPSGKPVPAKGKRPAGVAVYGVAGLGIGVKEGDVVTEIMGQPVRSAVQGIALIMAARAARRPVITGTVWRQARAIGVTVEQPYTIPDCDPKDAECWKSQCLEHASKANGRPAKAASAAAN